MATRDRGIRRQRKQAQKVRARQERKKERKESLTSAEHDHTVQAWRQAFRKVGYKRFESSRNPFPSSLMALDPATTGALTGDFARDLVLSSALLEQHASRLRHFVGLRSAFERALLHGDYRESRKALDSIEHDTGVSHWWAQSTLLVADLEGGLEANRASFQKLRSSAVPVMQLFLNYYSKRAESGVTAQAFTSEVSGVGKGRQLEPRYMRALVHFRFRVDHPSFAAADQLSSVLVREGAESAVDRLWSVTRILVTIADRESGSLNRILRDCAVELYAALSDPALLALVHVLSPARPILFAEPDKWILAAIEDYTRGDYSAAIKGAMHAINDSPERFEAYELFALARARVPGEKLPEGGTALSSRILRATCEIVARTGDARDALNTLFKFAQMLDGLPIGPQLEAFARKHLLGSDDVHLPGSPIMGSLLTARLSECFSSNEDADAYLDQLENAAGPLTSADLFRASRGLVPLPTALPERRRDRYLARSLARAGKEADAIPIYEKLLSDNTATPLELEEISRSLVRCYVATHRINEAARVFVATAASTALPVRQSTAKELLRLAEALPDIVDKGDISWPLLARTAQGPTAKDSRRTYVFFDDFLLHYGVDRPSALFDRLRNAPERSMAVAFLRDVCTTDTMAHSIAFRNSSELEDERISICRTLLALDPDQASAYSEELGTLTRNALVRRTIRHVDQSKVYIDVAGIRASLSDEFRRAFERYVSFTRLTGPLRETLEATGLLIGQPGRDVVLVTDESQRQFAALFNELKARFISSDEFGLDAYLSIRIRHGTLSGHVRSAFEREQLLTPRDASGTGYYPNVFWNESVSHFFGTLIAAQVDAALRDLSARVDAAIEEVKKNWIQICTKSTPEGLFNYDYTDREVRAVNIRLAAVREYDAFFAGVMEELWSRTRRNLERVQEKLKIELEPSLMSALDGVVERIGSIHPALAHGPLVAAINRVRTALSNDIGTIVEWFAVGAEQRSPDVAPGLLVEAAVEIATKGHPDIRPTLSATVSVGGVIRGDRVAPLADILFLLLDNVFRHGADDERGPSVKLFWKWSHIVLEVDNAVPSGQVEMLRSRVRQLNRIKADAVGGVVRVEGGSGYYKLHKLLRHDLACGDDYDVKVMLRDANRFCVRIVLSPAGVWLDENTRN